MAKFFVVVVLLFAGTFLKAQSPGHVRQTYVVKALYYTDSNTVHWETVKEGTPQPFIVEQYLWGRWEKVGEVMGKGSDTLNKYDYPIVLISGLNHIRVVQYGQDSSGRFSPALKANGPETTSTFTVINGRLHFSRATHYRLCAGGKVVLHGKGNTVDLSTLPKGAYTLQYDDQTAVITL